MLAVLRGLNIHFLKKIIKKKNGLEFLFEILYGAYQYPKLISGNVTSACFKKFLCNEGCP